MENTEKEKDTTRHIKTNWNEISGRIRTNFPGVTDRDLQFMSQGENELIGRLQMKTGKTKAQIRNWIRTSRIL